MPDKNYKGGHGKTQMAPIDLTAKQSPYPPSQRVGSNSRNKKNFSKEGNLCPKEYTKM